MIIFGQGELLNFISWYGSLPGSHIFGVLLKIRMIKKNDMMKREHFGIKFIRHKWRIFHTALYWVNRVLKSPSGIFLKI